MRKFFILSAVLILTVTETFAYAIKVYDEYGNRVGTYRKEGDRYQLYDFYDNKIDNPDNLIKDAPNQKTLTEYTRTFYDENMMPIGTWHSGYFGNNGRYYPRHGVFYPSNYGTGNPYIVRPHANTGGGIYKYSGYQNNVIHVDTRYPQFHKFQPYP